MRAPGRKGRPRRRDGCYRKSAGSRIRIRLRARESGEWSAMCRFHTQPARAMWALRLRVSCRRASTRNRGHARNAPAAQLASRMTGIRWLHGVRKIRYNGLSQNEQVVTRRLHPKAARRPRQADVRASHTAARRSRHRAHSASPPTFSLSVTGGGQAASAPLASPPTALLPPSGYCWTTLSR